VGWSVFVRGGGAPRAGMAAAAALATLGLLLDGCSAATTSGQTGRCSLTDLPAPGGSVPSRPALAVKVENLPVARPQYGLGDADVVYEEPVEGGITRFVVVYQCRSSPRIEPIRSARIVDPAIVDQFGRHPLFAYAGGIAPAVAAVQSSSLVDVGVDRAPGAYFRDPARPSPHNLASSTHALYAAASSDQPSAAPPAPVFRYGPVPSGAAPTASIHIGYPASDVTWRWDSQARAWLRSYGNGQAAATAEGGQISAANVVVMKVVVYPSPYVEDATGVHENLVTLTGSGSAQVFRDGVEVSGTWSRPSLHETTRYVDASGSDITLADGITWVELVPTTVAVTTG
jgi:hypothetical protein